VSLIHSHHVLLADPVSQSDLDERAEGRIRLSVLGGYLGSGKTTWLRHQLHAGVFKNAFVIVNEAAETPVDDALLQRSSRLTVLAGGCACCTGKAELIACLRSICDDRSKQSSDQPRLGRIVLETSGLADPGPIVEAIRSDPVLVHHIVVSEVLVTVDALHALAQLRSEPLGRRQIEIADCFMITKLDDANESDLQILLATLRFMNPGATMFGSIKGSEAALPDFTDVEPEILPTIAEGEDQSPIFPTRLIIDDTIDWAAFSVWLSALLHARGNDVVRVKGVVRTPAGRLLVQTVRKIVQSPEILPEQDDRPDREDNVIVVIGRGYEAYALTKSLRYFAGSSAQINPIATHGFTNDATAASRRNEPFR
jgi:G3E family GTPase